jgi:hypothetical protein
MKHLIQYKNFNEAVDPVELKKIETEKKNRILENKAKIDEYNKKSPLLKRIYTDVDNTGNFKIKDEDLDTKVIEILGKSDPKSGKYTNDLLQDLKTILSYERRVIKMQKSLTDDTISKDNFKQEVASTPDATSKKSISNKITEIDKRMNSNKNDISNLLIEFNKSKKELDLKVAKLKK